MNDRLIGFTDGKNKGWGYDTTQMHRRSIVSGVEFERFSDSGMDIATINHVGAMAKAWKTVGLSISLPPPNTIQISRRGGWHPRPSYYKTDFRFLSGRGCSPNKNLKSLSITPYQNI